MLRICNRGTLWCKRSKPIAMTLEFYWVSNKDIKCPCQWKPFINLLFLQRKPYFSLPPSHHINKECLCKRHKTVCFLVLRKDFKFKSLILGCDEVLKFTLVHNKSYITHNKMLITLRWHPTTQLFIQRKPAIVISFLLSYLLWVSQRRFEWHSCVHLFTNM